MKTYLSIALSFILCSCASTLAPMEQRSLASLRENIQDCGLVGSIDERIHDCQVNYDEHIKDAIILVSRSHNGEHKIFQDRSTGYLWTERLPEAKDLKTAERACKQYNDPTGLNANVEWYLPLRSEFQHLLRARPHRVLPSSDHWFWVVDNYTHKSAGMGRKVYGKTAQVEEFPRMMVHKVYVRCVGYPIN